MSLAMLFSVLFRSVATSLLSSLGIWIFIGLGLVIVALTIPTSAETSLMLLRFSPNWLFGDAGTVLLQPLPLESLFWVIGLVASGASAYIVPNPLSLGQSMLLVWPHVTSLVALTTICFAVSYVLFMRQEIRAA